MGPMNLLSREVHGLASRPGDLPEHLALKLALEGVLEGHTGCVNRLAWNQEGTLLASASDDCKVLLWHYPDTGRVPIALQTQHHANLFGVQFLPFSDNCRLVSGAMDYTVQLHELGAGVFNISPRFRSGSGGTAGSSSSRRHSQQQQQVHNVVPRTTVFHCHKSRVKEVEVCPAEPNLFWSAGEDGFVRQYDTRLSNQKAYGSPNALLDLSHAGRGGSLVECKGLDLNPGRPHLMALACGDAYVRVYDRRRLSTGVPGSSSAASAAQPLLRLTPPHLPLLLAAGTNRRAHSTHVNFSHRGDRLIASYHADHAYIFDVTGAGDGPPVTLQQQQQQGLSQQRQLLQQLAAAAAAAGAAREQAAAAAAAAGEAAVPADLPLPEAAEAAKVAGNAALFEQRFSAAVDEFSAAIAAAPWAPGLYTQRALAWLKRAWEGDAAYALRDCEAALALVAQSRSGGAAAAAAAEQQARLRQVHALKQLGQARCALAALDSYIRHCPSAAGSPELTSLSKVLQEQVQRQQDYRDKVRQQRQTQLQQQQRRRRLAAAVAGGAGGAAPQWRGAGQRVPPPPSAAAEEQGQQLLQQQPSEAVLQQRAAAYLHSNPPSPPPSGVATAAVTPTAEQRHLQQQAALAGRAVAAAGSRVMDVDGASAAAGDGSSRGTGSSSDSPGAPAVRAPPPPGPGLRIDTDLDSDDLEEQQQQQGQGGQQLPGSRVFAAAAAAADGEGFIGPVLPEAAAAAAAAAAVTPDLRPQRPAADIMSPDSDSGRDDDGYDEDDDSDDVSLSGDNDDSSELLLPWYGPSVFAQQQIDAAAAAAAAATAQGAQHCSSGSSGGGGRRRPRSCSCSDDEGSDDGGARPAAAAAAAMSGLLQQQGRQQQRRRRAAAAAAGGRQGPPAAAAAGSWWDVLSGGCGRLLQRCIGHCNVATDIKESVFLGADDALVACGSDDGNVFIYRADSGAAVRVLPADDDVANCVQAHPLLPVLATSGIDSAVRLWAPTAACAAAGCEDVVSQNQLRMRDGPRLLRGALPAGALQAALDDNPALLQLLVQQLYGTGPPAPLAAAGPRGQQQQQQRQQQQQQGGAPGDGAGAGGGGEGLGLGGGLQLHFVDRDDGRRGDEDDEDENDDDDDDDEAGGSEGGGDGAVAGRRRRRRGQEVACRVS